MKMRIKILMDPGDRGMESADIELLEMVLRVPKKYLKKQAEAYDMDGTDLEEKRSIIEGDVYVKVLELIE